MDTPDGKSDILINSYAQQEINTFDGKDVISNQEQNNQERGEEYERNEVNEIDRDIEN